MEIVVKLVFRKGLHVALVLHTRMTAPEGEWALALAAYERLAAQTKAEPARARFLVVSDGGTPTGVQRQQLAALWGGTPPKTAVVIPGMDNAIKRGVMTALTWINPSMGFFMPAQISRALSHVDLDGEFDAIWPDFVELQTKVAPSAMLDAIQRHAAPPSELRARRDPSSSRRMG